MLLSKEEILFVYECKKMNQPVFESVEFEGKKVEFEIQKPVASALAEMFGVSTSYINQIWAGKLFRKITGQTPETNPTGKKKRVIRRVK